MIKIRIRKLKDESWIVEGKCLFGWKGAYITRAQNIHGKELRFLSFASPSNVSYASFCIHKTHSEALAIRNEAIAMQGG